MRLSALRRAAGRLPINLMSAASPLSARPPNEVRPSCATARSTASRSARSIRSTCSPAAERMSTLMAADSGIEFTEVPPVITPTLKVVFGEAGTGVRANRSMARASTTIGLAVPKSLQEWPPGPKIVTRKRLLPSASVTMVSVPAPSSTMVASMASRQHGSAKM